MSENKERPIVICVLGMHRSGTSMLMRLLNICGVYIGEKDELYPDLTGNEKGHWESQEVLDINNKILKIFKGSYENPPNFSDGWEADPRLEKLKIRAKEFIAKMNDKNEIWGFKDPRTCLTLPFWKKLIPNMIYVIPIRKSMEIAMSLKKRNEFPLRKSFYLWIKYWIHILKNTENEVRYFTLFENFFWDWKSELEKIIEFVNHPKVSLKGKEKEIEEFITPSIYHEKTKDISAFNKNQDELNKDNEAISKSLFNDIDYSIEKIYLDSEKEINNAQEQFCSIFIKEKDKIIKSKSEKIKHLNNLLKEKETRIRDFKKMFNEIKKMFDEVKNKAEKKEQILKINNSMIAERDKMICLMKNSKFWKIRGIYISFKKIFKRRIVLDRFFKKRRSKKI